MGVRGVVVPAALALACALPAAAQRAGAVLDPDTATVGQVAAAVLAVELPAGWTLALPDSLGLAGDLENAAPRAVSVDTLAGGARRVTVRYALTAWRPGEHALPSIDVVLIGPDDGVRERRSVPLPPLIVASVLPADTAGIEPRPPKDVLGPDRSLARWLLAALLAALAVALAVWLARRRRGRGELAEEPWISPRERALEALERVRAAGLLERGEIKPFYGGVTAALRGYLGALADAWGTDLTTRELEARLNGDLPPAARAELLALLAAADRVKFAGGVAASEEARAEWERARRWVEALPEPAAGEGEAGEAADPSGTAGAAPEADGAAAAKPAPDTGADEARFRPPPGAGL